MLHDIVKTEPRGLRRHYMAERQEYEYQRRMMPLSELSDYDVADDSDDVRGWDAVTRDDREFGDVDDLIVDLGTMKARYLVIDVHDGDKTIAGDRMSHRSILIPVERAQIDEPGHRVRVDAAASTLSTLPAYDATKIDDAYDERFGRAAGEPTARPAGQGARRLTRSAEEVRIGKRTVPAGEVSVRKHVETEHVSQPATKTREDVHIDRRPAAGPARPGEIRDEEIRIPITEEELVVEKRPVVKEEIIVSKEKRTDTENVEADVRKEKVDVERKGPGGSDRGRRGE
jgi:uncharacterized protein (TIGR02271 family)